MKAKVIHPFYDLKEKVNRKKDETFELTAERFNQIAKRGAYIEAIEDKAEDKAVKA